MPEDFRVAEILLADVQHRVAGILGPGAAPVVAVGDLLVLQWLFRVVPGVDGDERRLAIFAQTAGVLPVHHRAAGEDHHIILFGQSQRQVLPVRQILADGVPPAHVAPRIADRVVLLKEVVLPLEVHHPVGIVHPVDFRREMKLRTITLAVVLG